MIQIELKKAEMMKKTIDKFAESPQQQEFYKLLLIRLCNLFDATRAATTGICQHALTGTLGKVSWGFMILGQVLGFVPGVGQNVTQVLGFVEKGLKKSDEVRIQNALTHIGCLETAQKLHETANEISEKLTIMYEWQIKQFSTSDKSENTEQSSKCCACCNSCIGCLRRTTNYITNQREDTTMQTIAKYANSLILARLTEIETSKIDTIIHLRDSFLNAVCNLSHKLEIRRKLFETKIEPVEAKNEDDYWDTYQFFRGPAILFSNGDRQTDKHMNHKKFGYRHPSWNEEEWHKTDSKKLEILGFTKVETEEQVKD